MSPWVFLWMSGPGEALLAVIEVYRLLTVRLHHVRRCQSHPIDVADIGLRSIEQMVPRVLENFRSGRSPYVPVRVTDGPVGAGLVSGRLRNLGTSSLHTDFIRRTPNRPPIAFAKCLGHRRQGSLATS
ncbi:hypothetical protein C8Q73DRAFT_490527 [Cubamyces lactineus]|nr:hypothetical protein C8Q73DRAFT_490527 [Cubamyces lactineus]